MKQVDNKINIKIIRQNKKMKKVLRNYMKNYKIKKNISINKLIN